ncbi:NitT/TauT family transport system ATP-binding protein [Faunimonas pinastri]|uniref:NitT/TauT family transport system ATP-binding protein n=1 Tax=Faunimonas pinastri TaxID=1855383 RepID=A0A1H9B739_9HYPH|nr:ABC transporter ATP-binding protein [Faunimonas pinastri]SEP84645.1 NitT/TauT family transport system ATP-binding protein [Faunimonas pinastri]
MAHLSVTGISKTFGTVPVLVDQSLEVEQGEFVALLGPSGCGKSTLLQIINGLIPADSGRVVLDGEDITGRTGSGRGMVFQGADLFPWRTAIENIAFGLQVKGVGKAERLERARHYLELVGLRGFENAWPHQLSGGMQQRVGIARAFCIQPSLLLMDEPFGALDVQTRDILQDELVRIWEAEPKMVLFVTHGIEEALYLADRILVFSKRPARVLSEIKVPFARPRHDDMKLDPEFLRLRREISELLRHDLEA